jgi:hypothetical protein
MGFLDRIKSAAAESLGAAIATAFEPSTAKEEAQAESWAKRAAAMSLAKLGGKVVPEMPLWGSFLRIGGNLTPEQVTNILRQADGGRPYQLVDLVHECRQKDGHLQSILQVREKSLSALPFAVLPREDEQAIARRGNQRSKTAAQRRATQCGLAISRAHGFRENREHLNGESLLFGHATSEICWRLATEQDGPALSGMMIPDRFVKVDNRRFGFRWNDAALLYDPYTDLGGIGDVTVSGVDLLAENPPGKFIQIRRRINGDVLVREGLGRVLMWAALFRNWGLRDWLTAAEMSWKPWRLGTYKKSGAKTEDINLLEQIMLRMSSTGAAAVPDTVDVRVEWPKGATSGTQSLHRELCEFLAGEMSKAVLGQTMTTEAGSRGARSLGDTQAANSLKPLLASDADIIDAAITEQLVVPFYMMNFGSYDGAVFASQTQDKSDLAAFARAITDLRDAGHEVQQGWVRDQIGQPPPIEGEPMLGDEEEAEEDDGDGDTDSTGAPAGDEKPEAGDDEGDDQPSSPEES